MKTTQSGVYRVQTGQALAEFLVVAGFVLVPIALGSVYLMKIGNAQHEMQEAARYAAWERTVWPAAGTGSHQKANAAVLNETVARVLGEPGRAIDSREDGRAVAPGNLALDPMLGINTGSGARAPVFRETAGALHSFSFNDAKAASGAAAGALGSLVAFGLDLNENGLQTSTISWQHDWIPALDFGWQPILSSSTNTLLTESWNAGSPARIKDSIDGIVATSLIADLGIASALNTLSGLARFKDFRKLDLGKIDVDRMPCHRLAKARGRQSC